MAITHEVYDLSTSIVSRCTYHRLSGHSLRLPWLPSQLTTALRTQRTTISCSIPWSPRPWMATCATSTVHRRAQALALASVHRAMSQVAQPAALSIRQVASALYGRPAIDPGGASEFDILEPLMQTDTKSYQDFAICQDRATPEWILAAVDCGQRLHR